MSRTHPFVQRHLPHITPRIEFNLAPPPDLPIITPRIDFAGKRLLQQDQIQGRGADCEEDEDSDSGQESLAGAHPLLRATSVPMQRTASFGLRAQSLPIPHHTSRARFLIQKPRGEPGRPNSGGFSLEDELRKNGWAEADIGVFMAEVRQEVKYKLNGKSTSIRGQNTEVIQQICDLMSSPDRWPILTDYDKCWPVRSALKLALKYAAEAAKKHKATRVTRSIHKVLNESNDT